MIGEVRKRTDVPLQTGQTEISGRCYDKNGEYNVVNFACAKSRRVGILHNLTDMCQKPSAGFGLRMDRVPVAYHRALTSVLPVIQTPSHSIKDVTPLFIKNKKFFPTHIVLYKHLL
jgi:hypothetical protein